jgi:chromatin segregation and condensation protein Rec8/ScpA/Scc1 (kleisin family)
LDDGGTLDLQDIFNEGQLSRGDAAYYLVALLELAKQKAIDLKQDSAFGNIQVVRANNAAEVHLDDLDEQFDRHGDEMEPEVESLLEE